MKVRVYLVGCLLSFFLVTCSNSQDRHHEFIVEVIRLLADSSQGLPADWTVDQETYLEATENDTIRIPRDGSNVYPDKEERFEFFQIAVQGHWSMMQTDAQRLGWKVGSVLIDSISAGSPHTISGENVFEYFVYVSDPMRKLAIQILVLDDDGECRLWGMKWSSETVKEYILPLDSMERYRRPGK